MGVGCYFLAILITYKNNIKSIGWTLATQRISKKIAVLELRNAWKWNHIAAIAAQRILFCRMPEWGAKRVTPLTNRHLIKGLFNIYQCTRSSRKSYTPQNHFNFHLPRMNMKIKRKSNLFPSIGFHAQQMNLFNTFRLRFSIVQRGWLLLN